MTETLAGKRAIVTAGASGIGKVVAERLIDAGALVAVCDIDRHALDEFQSRNSAAFAYYCDVGLAKSVTKTIGHMKAQLGGVDILINNAGSAGPTANIENISPEEWARTVEINLSSQFLFIREIVEDMKRRNDGVIVNMSSAAGRLGMPFRTPYVAAKWAIVGLT